MRKITKMLSKRNAISTFSVVTLASLIAIFNIPILARNVPNAILIGLMVLFAASVFLRLFCMEAEEKISFALLIVYMVAITAYKILNVSTAELYYYFNIVQYYFFFAAVMLIYKSLTPQQIRILLTVAIVTMILTIVSNIYLCVSADSPNAYVNMYKTHRYTSNATNTQFATAMLTVAGAAFVGAQSQKIIRRKIAMYAICGLCVIFAVGVAQRLIVAILAGVMFPLMIAARWEFPKMKHWSKRQVALIAAVGITLVLLCVFYKPVLQWVGEVIGSPRISKRIDQIIVLLETGDFAAAGGSLGTRYALMKTSWETFTGSLANFFLGVGDHRADNLVIGNHSLIIDELARYGIVIAALSFALIAYSFVVVRKMSGVKAGTIQDRQLLVLFAVLIMRAFVGALFDASIGIALFVVTPLLLRLEMDENKQESQNTKA